MKSLASTTGKLALALLIVLCLAASSTPAAEAAAAGTVSKPTPHPSNQTVSNSTQRPTAKRPASSSTTTHSTYHRTTTSTAAAHTGTTHSPAHRYSATTAGKTPSRATAYSSQHQAATTHNRYSRPAPVSALSGWQRLARLRLQPERVQEIQQALIREGYLQGETSGLWDTRTHDAMLRYQTEHGFPATGLPEAKSLMKLGLGSHPLPPELDHTPAGISAPGAAQGALPAPVASPPVSLATPPS